MYRCFDEQMTVHWVQGGTALCGRSDMMEEAAPEDNERRCKTCEKAKRGMIEFLPPRGSYDDL